MNPKVFEQSAAALGHQQWKNTTARGLASGWARLIFFYFTSIHVYFWWNHHHMSNGRWHLSGGIPEAACSNHNPKCRISERWFLFVCPQCVFAFCADSCNNVSCNGHMLAPVSLEGRQMIPWLDQSVVLRYFSSKHVYSNILAKVCGYQSIGQVRL